MKEFNESGGSSKLVKKIEERRPKKALSAYMIFVRETRQVVWEQNPNMHALEVMKEVGRTWQNLNANSKVIYEEKAQADKIRYQNELEIFQNDLKNIEKFTKSECLEISKIPPEKSFNKWSTENVAKEKDILKVEKCESKLALKNRKRADTAQAKRPLTAYIYFSQEVGFDVILC